MDHHVHTTLRNARNTPWLRVCKKKTLGPRNRLLGAREMPQEDHHRPALPRKVAQPPLGAVRARHPQRPQQRRVDHRVVDDRGPPRGGRAAAVCAGPEERHDESEPGTHNSIPTAHSQTKAEPSIDLSSGEALHA